MSFHDDENNQDVSLMAMDQYMRFVRWTPELTPEEEKCLLERVERGRQEQRKSVPNRQVLEEARQARDRLVEGLQALVIYIANQYKRRVRSMELLDLIQEGNLGLLEAIACSERRTGDVFSGFAGECIRHAILTALYYRDRHVRYTMQTERALSRLRYVQSQLALALERDPSLEELAEALSLGREKVRDLLELHEQGQVESLHRLFEGEEEEERPDFVQLFGAAVVADDGRQVYQAAVVRQAMEAALSVREREVLRLRYGLDGECQMQREVAAALGMATSSIQRIEYQAKARLQEQLASMYAVADEELSA